MLKRGKMPVSVTDNKNMYVLFTMLLLGRSRSGAPLEDVFSISEALFLDVVLQFSNITPRGSEGRVVGRNTRQKGDNKKKH